MSSTISKDPKEVLLAFASLVNEFYGSDTQSQQDPQAPSALEENGGPGSLRYESGPWDAYEVHKKMGVNLQVEPGLYKKMTWLTENLPKMSLQKLAKMGLEAEVDRLLALHYRPE